MCGRFTLSYDAKSIEEYFDAKNGVENTASYNITPSQDIPVIWQDAAAIRHIRLMHWGLIPHWSKQPSSKYKMINARADSLRTKPAYREAYRKCRCLIPADGFYEWHTSKGTKQPYYIQMMRHQLFAFAGLWELWQGEQTLYSCTIITTEANPLLRTIHERMPVILQAKDYPIWLDQNSSIDALEPLLTLYQQNDLTMYPVSNDVNNPHNNHAGLIQRAPLS